MFTAYYLDFRLLSASSHMITDLVARYLRFICLPLQSVIYCHSCATIDFYLLQLA